ncbi:hypothetical protein BOW53_11355 [Solemya pervernicosa gill symbiont]|uniref:Cyclic nucleotide-binding protein n=1 Tax=Solemya pervernicosa gill symbiont TaxID=642797 RepID=A0A1T2L3C3_9GAMM|nr:cyclic nucleotide-binding domain-containing protein [Solemya pervernicosa gill symbiont]OOZ39500.1 hypothetical protein BOW53_11355 [Solemya pervernicosa gill symbiont]
MNEESEHVDVDTLKGLEPVSSLSSERLQELADQTVIEFVEPDTTLFTEGDRDRRLFYLLEGEIELSSSIGNSQRVITAGMPETWHPIGHKLPRQATAKTLSHAEVIRIDADIFDNLLTWDQMAGVDDSSTAEDDHSNDASTEPGVSNQTLGQLHTSSILQQLPAANLEQLLARMERIEAKPTEMVIKQGDPGDYFYLLESGVVSVTRSNSPGEAPVELVQLGEGASFGEEALISDNPRNANVVMVTDGTLLRLNKQNFVELLKEPMLNWLSFGDLLEELEEGAELIDVRVPAEYDQGHLPGAINVPLQEIRQHLAGLDRELHHLIYCNTGRRSSAAAFLLSQDGLKSSVLTDGLKDVPSAYLIR